MSRKIPASEYMGYDKYIGDEEDMVVDIPIKHESKPYLMIPLPNGATNGDVIKAVFDVTEVRQLDCCAFIDTSDDANMRTYKDWWNAPYERR